MCPEFGVVASAAGPGVILWNLESRDFIRRIDENKMLEKKDKREGLIEKEKSQDTRVFLHSGKGRKVTHLQMSKTSGEVAVVYQVPELRLQSLR